MALKSNIHFDEIVKPAPGGFHGGIHPHEHKIDSNQAPIKRLPLSAELILPRHQSLGEVGEVLVSAGEKITAGLPLVANHEFFGAGVHSPAQGTVSALVDAPCGHPSGLPRPCVKISVDSGQPWPPQPSLPAIDWRQASTNELLNRVKQASIVGLGGATFPTDLKMANNKIETLIVNAMECEPYITCDDRLMQERPDELLEGAMIGAKIVGAKAIIFATEDNKPDAISSLKQTIKNTESELDISIVVAPTRYPSGGEKQTIELVTKNQLPAGKLPASIGLLIQNVATLHAVYRAVVEGYPLTERLVTITGDLAENAGNYWIPFGTPIREIVRLLEIDASQCPHVVMGGPLMGQRIDDLSVPVTKATNCLIFNREDSWQKPLPDENTAHQACIRCSDCQNVCPVELLPQQLYWFSAADEFDNAETQGLFDCIECGACAFVCPSEIPLVQYFRYGKASIRKTRQNQANSERAKSRFDFREMRIARAKAERALKHQKAAEARRKAAEDKAKDPSGKQAAINAALERVKQKKNQEPTTSGEAGNDSKDSASEA